MTLTVVKQDKTPIYKQIEQQLVHMISTGTLKAGDRLPTESRRVRSSAFIRNLPAEVF